MCGSYSVYMKRTAAISFRITDELKEALERLAVADRRSLSSYIEIVLEDHVAKNTKRLEKQK